MKVIDVLKKLESLKNPKNIEGMKRFSIPGDYGVSAPALRAIAKEVGKDHNLALSLWKSGKHEARLLCALIDDFKLVTEEQMNSWVKDFDSWDLTDNTCMHLFRKTPYAYKKVYEWAGYKWPITHGFERSSKSSPSEFVKRAAFTLIACLAVHDKVSPDNVFIKFLEIIKREALDERNFVRKAINWALRSIGKKNKALNIKAIALSKELIKSKNKTACWIGKDALRELTSPIILKKIKF